MGRSYGKMRKKTARTPKPPGGTAEPLKIRLRGKDNTPLSMKDLQQGLYDAARALKVHDGIYRAKFATVYLTLIDEYGNTVQLNAKNEIVIYPYKAAADDYAE